MTDSKAKSPRRRMYIIGGILLVVIAIVVVLMNRQTTTRNSNATTRTAKVSSVTVTDTIQTSGTLNAVQSASLNWKTSGAIEKVNVKIGDHVQKGDVLLSLQAASASSNIISAQSDLVSAKTNLNDVLHSNLALAQAETDLAAAKQAVEDAQKNVTKLDYRRASDDLINQTESEIILAKQQVSRAESAFNLLKGRPNGDAGKAQAELNLVNARLNRDNKIATLAWYLGTPSDIDAAKYRAAFDVAQAQEANAQREVDRLKNGPTAEDIAAAQAKVDAAQATVNSLYVIAPFDGDIIAVYNQPNDLVDSSTLAVIVANTKTYTVDAKVDETDITKLIVGQPVEVKLDALPTLKLTGKVESISLFGQSVSGIVKYDIFVSVESKDTLLPLGSTANLTIQVSAPTQMLAVPITAVYTDAKGEYILRVGIGSNQQRVDIQSGDIVGSLVAVTGDLKEGDRILLTQTNATTSNSSTSGGNTTRPRGGFFGP
ncbi:MAG: efflux RND transporter periplasmic adaptor subunit [Chloroflexota bacterium]